MFNIRSNCPHNSCYAYCNYSSQTNIIQLLH